MSSSRRFVLLDRDGTLIEERHYLSDPDEVAILPGAIPGLRRLRELGFGLAIVSNQSGIGRGLFDTTQLEQIHQRMIAILTRSGVTIDGIYVCPHTPDDNCDCRKPRPGLALQAAARHGFRLNEAIVIGDKPCDIDLGKRVGACTILVRTGYGREHEEAGGSQPDYVTDDLTGAAEIVAGLDCTGRVRPRDGRPGEL